MENSDIQKIQEAQEETFKTFVQRVKGLNYEEIIKEVEIVIAIEDEKMKGKVGHTRAMSPSGSFMRSPTGSFLLAKPKTLLGQKLKALMSFLKDKKLPMLPKGSNIPSPYADVPSYKEIAALLVAKGQWEKEVLDLFK